MLSVLDVWKMFQMGEELPQQKFPPITDAQICEMQRAEAEIVNNALTCQHLGDKVASSLTMAHVRRLGEQFGWYPTVTVLCMLFARRYEPGTVPELGSAPEGFNGLLRMFSIAREAEDREEGAWTVPLAILVDLGEEKALEITAAAALCAAIGHVHSVAAGGDR